jgi:hypothetical protein
MSTSFDNLVAVACSKVVETPLTWRMHGVDINLPSDIHGGTHGHRYDMTCAVCRVSDRPEALAVVVRAALEAAGVPALLDVVSAARRIDRCYHDEEAGAYANWDADLDAASDALHEALGRINDLIPQKVSGDQL